MMVPLSVVFGILILVISHVGAFFSGAAVSDFAGTEVVLPLCLVTILFGIIGAVLLI